MCATSAYAQTYTFDIPSEAAIKAIPEFARQERIKILAPAEGLDSVNTPAVKGVFEVHAALSTLLKGTGVSVGSDDGHTVILVKQKQLAPELPPRSTTA